MRELRATLGLRYPRSQLDARLKYCPNEGPPRPLITAPADAPAGLD
jgi:hypothetical protein